MLLFRVIASVVLWATMLGLPGWLSEGHTPSLLNQLASVAAAEDEESEPSEDKPHHQGNKKSDTSNPDRRKLRTNDLGTDGVEIEGEVISVRCDRKPPEIMIGTVDGHATIRVMPNKKSSDDLDCEEVHRGFYLRVEYAEKQNELLYDGYKFSVEGQCDKDDNGNDNGEDVEYCDD